MDDEALKIHNWAMALKEARVSHADEIYEIQRQVNRELGGDASIDEIVSLMVVRGWSRPPSK